MYPANTNRVKSAPSEHTCEAVQNTKDRSTYHMSIEALYSVDPRRTSGGLYHNVTTSLEYVFVGTDLARANPKSANFNSPFSLIRRFCGFKSL